MKLSFLLMLLFSLINCQAQKTDEVKLQPVENSLQQNIVGRWYNVERNILLNGKKEILKDQKCLGKSYMEFTKQGNDLKLKISTADGINCERIVNSEKPKVEYNNGTLSYFDHDILVTKLIKFISENEFIIYRNDVVIDGKVVTIEDVYRRR